MSLAIPTRRVADMGTAGLLTSLSDMIAIRDTLLPPTATPSPLTFVLDLGDGIPTIPVLRELVISVGQRVRGGVYGDFRLVIATADEDVAEMVALLARKHELPLFISKSSDPDDVHNSIPAELFSTSETETLEELKNLGGVATVAALAGAVGAAATAVNNRLKNLEKRGYVYRLPRGRKYGDLYIDPRASVDNVLERVRSDIPPPRTALLANGIRSNPYDRSRIELEGEAAERALEILRRKNKGG